MNQTTGQLMLAFPNLIYEDQVTVMIRFNYTLNQGLSGFYRSHYSGESLHLPVRDLKRHL